MPPQLKTIRGKTAARQVQKSFKSDLKDRIEVCFLLQDWDDSYNVGGMFRVADGVGASRIVLTGHTPAPPDPMIAVTSLGAHRRVRFTHFDSHEQGALSLKADGWALVAVEIAEGAVPYIQASYPQKTCFVLGNEASGVYGSVLKHCDLAVYIPMLGKGRSLNVHVAAAVVAYDALLRPR